MNHHKTKFMNADELRSLSPLKKNPLLKLTERYCVVQHTIASATPVDSQITTSILKVS